MLLISLLFELTGHSNTDDFCLEITERIETVWPSNNIPFVGFLKKNPYHNTGFLSQYFLPKALNKC